MNNLNSRKVPVTRLQHGKRVVSSDELAVEAVISLNYNGKRLATLLASPTDLEDLIIGHLASEGYMTLDHLMECKGNGDVVRSSGGIEISLHHPAPLLNEIRTAGITNTSCGACNVDGLEELITELPFVDRKLDFDPAILHRGLENMRDYQHGFAKTGGMHCAGLLSIDGHLVHVAEDIGRHNAVDKLIGKSLGDPALKSAILLLSGRCGWDIVAKAARANICTIASIGAASTLAVDCARRVGIQIYSFVRADSAIIIG